MDPKKWVKNSRFYILLFSALIAVGIFLSNSSSVFLDQDYALFAVGFLYLAVLATPLTELFPNLPGEDLYLHSRRALGVSAFFFALFHSLFAFFGELGGFVGLPFLGQNYYIAMILGAASLLILFLMAATSFDWAVGRLTFTKWKNLHRFVYLAILLTTVHALLLGTHFTNLSGTIPQIFFILLSFLLILESIRFDKFIKAQNKNLPSFGVIFGACLILISVGGYYLLGPQSSTTASPLNVHALHIQIAQQAQQGNFPPGLDLNNPAISQNPGLIGDRTLRFDTDFTHPDNISQNQDTNLSFQIYNASSGNIVDLFSFVYSKVMHLVIVDDSLNYFNHIHPTQSGSQFNITTQFPHLGVYHLYINYQPLGAIEQQNAFTLNVGNAAPTVANFLPDTNLTKTFGNYQVTLDYPKPLKAANLSIGKQQLSFTILDAKTKNPITTLKPYLAAYGHLVMINESTYDYIHVHPTNIFPPTPDTNGGPIVDFLPLGLYGPIKPGIYRVFAQFNPDNNLFTADFTVKIEP